MSKVMMVCGSTGAGKSTLSNELAKQYGAVVFSIDPWMQCLYGQDYDPGRHDFTWITCRTSRCEAQMRQVAEQLLRLGQNVVLEAGFGREQARRACRRWAEGQRAQAELYYLDTPRGERLRRVRRRNLEQGETYAFCVTDEMFEYAEPLFEPPSREEQANGEGYVYHYIAWQDEDIPGE